MTFKDWITKKFTKWRGDKVTGASVAAFAKYVGVSQQLMSDWMSGRRSPGRASITKIAKVYPDIYEVIGVSPDDPLSGIPASFRDRLRGAAEETNAELESRGLTADDPEAEKIVIDIFERWGFKYTHTSGDAG